jgi:crotonobetainyl-CoA:carnitine CoA-transferase CaiB-like acyl-CoA transferase
LVGDHDCDVNTLPSADTEYIVRCETWPFSFTSLNIVDRLIGHQEMVSPINPQRVANRTTLVPIVERLIAAHTREYWIERCAAAGVPCGPVRDVAELLSDPQMDARGMITSMHHQMSGDIRLVAGAIKFSDNQTPRHAAPPALGQHSAAILMNDLGFSREEIASLRAEDVI